MTISIFEIKAFGSKILCLKRPKGSAGPHLAIATVDYYFCEGVLPIHPIVVYKC